MLEVKPPKLNSGGISCKSCKFWFKYSDDLQGKCWGACTNNSVNLQARLGADWLRNTDMVKIEKLDGITTVSTYSSYSCPNYQKLPSN